MLRLLGVLLSCGALCLASPVPPTTGTNCAIGTLIRETLSHIEMLKAKGRSRITTLNDMLKAEGNTTTYLEGFIEALKSSEKRPKERQIAQNLQKIQDTRKSCLGWMELDWQPEEEDDFFSNLEYLLRFLNHNAPSEDTI